MVAARTPNIPVPNAVLSAGRKTSKLARPAARRKTRAGELGREAAARTRSSGRRGPPSRRTPAASDAASRRRSWRAVPRGRRDDRWANCVARWPSAFDADRTCPLMTGIFATILAGAVVDDLGQRRKPRWPIWRLVRDDGTLHPKWPLDPLYRATMLREEGVRITHRHGHWAALDTQHC